jgi:hypothetical protein
VNPPLSPEAVRSLAAKFCPPKPGTMPVPALDRRKSKSNTPAPVKPASKGRRRIRRRSVHRQALVELLEKDGPASSPELAKRLGRSLAKVSADLGKLAKAGRIQLLQPCRRNAGTTAAVYGPRKEAR